MQINKGKWLGGIGIIVVLIAAVPYATGKLVKRKFGELLTVFSELDPVSIQLLDYREGWLSSTAKTRVTFRGKTMPVVTRWAARAGLECGCRASDPSWPLGAGAGGSA